MFETPEGPRVVQAASLALAVMRVTKLPWPATRDNLPSTIGLSQQQVELLQEFDSALEGVHPTQAEGVDQTVSIYACDECGRWAYIASGAAPKKCNLTLWCSGANVKASAAKKV